MAGNSRDPGRSVTSRVLSIFDAFDIDHPRLSLSGIARRTGLPLATVHRLVQDLLEWRGLERDEEGLYRIGLRLWEVGLLGRLSVRLREVALPYMQSLYEATRENVQLAVRDGYDALYVEKLSGHQSVPIVTRIGGRLPMHATGVGKALLAFQSPDFVRGYLDRPLERPTPYTITEPGRLSRDLDGVRRRGYAVTSEEMTLGSCSLAAPILDGEGRAVAAVSIVVHAVRIEPEKLAAPVQAAARSIAARLAAAADVPGRPGSETAGERHRTPARGHRVAQTSARPT